MKAHNNKLSWNMLCLITVIIPYCKIRQEMLSGLYNQDAPVQSSSSFVTHGLHDDSFVTCFTFFRFRAQWWIFLALVSFFSVHTLKTVLNGYTGFRLNKPYKSLHFHLNTCHHKGKGKTVHVHAMDAWGSAGIVPLILNLSTTVNHHILIFKQYIFINSENMRA
jgi:hypothetical protein